MSEMKDKGRVKVKTRLEKFSSREAFNRGEVGEVIEYEKEYERELPKPAPQRKDEN